MMAYKLKGTFKAYDSDYVDDGEHGTGCRLLAVLNEQNVSSITVFVTRFYGGQHLGARHFEIIIELAEMAVQDLEKGKTQYSRLKLQQFLDPAATVKTRRFKTRGKAAMATAYDKYLTEMLANKDTDPKEMVGEGAEGMSFLSREPINFGTANWVETPLQSENRWEASECSDTFAEKAPTQEEW